MNLINGDSPDIILNLGTGKFFLHQTAESLDDLGRLTATISGVTRLPKLIDTPSLNKLAKIARLKNRMSSINPMVKQVQVLPGEILWQIATAASKSKYFAAISKPLYFFSARAFDFAARGAIKRCHTKNSVYHFRAGFGGHSVQLAKSIGIPTICDHSISHPQYDWANRKPSLSQTIGFFNLERLILADINSADHVIVNSEFVATTFLICGDTRKVNVITPPIDRKFVKEARQPFYNERTGIIYIGKCELRKGIDIFADIVKSLPSNIPVRVVGSWNPEAIAYRRILESLPNVQIFPYLGYLDLVRMLRSSVVFLFPSRAEGSARVVGEAMHAGCIPFITQESGLNLDITAGYLINDMKHSEICENIVRILYDKVEQMKFSSSAKNTIQTLEKSYLPELLLVYKRALQIKEFKSAT